MKRYLIMALAVGLAAVLIPSAWCAKVRGGAGKPAPDVPSTLPSTEETLENETVTVFMSDTGEARTLSMREYIICAVAGEMPAAYEAEALKAQALASVTLTRYMKRHNQNNEGLSGAVSERASSSASGGTVSSEAYPGESLSPSLSQFTR